MNTKINSNIHCSAIIIYLYHLSIIYSYFNNTENRCRDIKTHKIYKQSQGDTNVKLKFKQTTSIIALHDYLHCYKAKDKELYLCRTIKKWFIKIS